MLEAAHVKPGDVVYDLGSGDGRIVITAAQKFGARGVGVEIRAGPLPEGQGADQVAGPGRPRQHGGGQRVAGGPEPRRRGDHVPADQLQRAAASPTWRST